MFGDGILFALTLFVKRISNLRPIVCLMVACFGLISAGAQTFHVRSGATGSGTGADWNNAFSRLPSTLIRGATYYIADGTYGGLTLSDPLSGTKKITIKKATTSDHGVNTGWATGFGDGQALFNGTVSFRTSYYEFNGVTGGGPENQWTNNFGFKIKVSGSLGKPASGVVCQAPFIAVRHTHIQGGATEGTRENWSYGFEAFPNIKNTTYSYGWVQDTSNKLYATYAGLCEYVYFDKAYPWDGGSGYDSMHVNIIRCWPMNGDVTIRYNFFTYYEPTGLITIAGDVYNTCDSCKDWDAFVYGNIIDATQRGDVGGGGTVRSFSGRGGHNRFYGFNNSFMGNEFTFTSPDSPTFQFHGPQGPIADARWINNIYAHAKLGGTPGSWSANSYFRVPDAPVLESGFELLTRLPWVDELSGNFRLLAPTTKGVDLKSLNSIPLRHTADPEDTHTFHLDMYGKVRGADGVWDRGAVEFHSGLDTTSPKILDIEPNVNNGTAVISWTTDEETTGVLEYGTLITYGTTLNSTKLQANHSLSVPLLTGISSLNFRITSTDASGNMTRSENRLLTLPSSDSTPPVVALVEPKQGDVISGMVNLTASGSDTGTGVKNVQFFVDGVSVGNVQGGSSPYVLSWNSYAVVNGLHTISVTATDGNANQAEFQTVSVSVNNTTEQALLNGMLLHLSFNGSNLEGSTPDVSLDSTPNENNAKLMNGVGSVPGKHSLSLSLDGIDDYAQVYSSPTLESATKQLTISAWINVESNGKWQAITRKILQEQTHEFPYAAFDLIVEDTNGTPRPRMSVSRFDGSRGVAYGSPLSYGAWYHVVGVYNGDSVDIYVNGVKSGSAPFAGEVISTGQPLLLGRNAIGGDNFKGLIDEFRVYNRAITEGEVQALYSAKKPAEPKSIKIQ